jgi:hypothetical protein
VLLTVAFVPNTLTAISFTYIVPGNQQWRPRSVLATVTTGAGGQPNRGYTLAFTDGTNTVAQVGADDNGAEPASGTITWANAPSASSAAGSTFSSIAPIPDLILNPGYHIVGTILHPAGADTWVSAIVWYEYVDTAAP